MTDKPAPKPRIPWKIDNLGKPLPEYILNGSVAYVPMVPSEEYRKRREFVRRNGTTK